MPIRPENRRHYTKAAGWPEIRARVLKRAEFLEVPRCEFCGVSNGYRIVRFRAQPSLWRYPSVGDEPSRIVRVVLTIAHLNQDPTDNRLCNLRALCQRCHNLLDAPWRARNAAATRARKAAAHA